MSACPSSDSLPIAGSSDLQSAHDRRSIGSAAEDASYVECWDRFDPPPETRCGCSSDTNCRSFRTSSSDSSAAFRAVANAWGSALVDLGHARHTIPPQATGPGQKAISC